MKLDNLYSFNPDLKEERIIDKKTFFCSSIGRLLDYAKVLGKIRFVYDPIISKFTVGNAENFTHIGLFANSIKAGNYDDKFDEYDNDDKDEYYGGNLEGPELTGAIIMKIIQKIFYLICQIQQPLFLNTLCFIFVMAYGLKTRFQSMSMKPLNNSIKNKYFYNIL